MQEGKCNGPSDHRQSFSSAMAESEKGGDLTMEQTLRLFYQRAYEAEERLSRLEAAIARKDDSGNEEYLRMIKELQLKLENANAEELAERERAEKLAVENGKLQYRIIHLLRMAKEAQQRSDQL